MKELSCPSCNSTNLVERNPELVCAHCGHVFTITTGKTKITDDKTGAVSYRANSMLVTFQVMRSDRMKDEN